MSHGCPGGYAIGRRRAPTARSTARTLSLACMDTMRRASHLSTRSKPSLVNSISRTTRACPQTPGSSTLCSMATSELSDAQWEKLRPLLPPQKPCTGRPAKDHRPVVEGRLWILRTGSPWRALPAPFGSWKTVSSRFYRWRRAGVWDRILAALQRRADADGRLDWSLHFVDSTVVRAHQHAAGAKGGTRTVRRWGAVGVGTARRSTCAASAAASHWRWS